MKELSFNIGLGKFHSMQNVPSSPSGEETRWGLLARSRRFFAALGSALNDGIRCGVLSNWEIASVNNATERHGEDGNYEDLLKWI